MIDRNTVIQNINNTIDKVNFPKLGKRESGKVRDWYRQEHFRVLIATDRISAFDRVLGLIPFRGAVLNKLSQFWFEKTRDIVANHMIGVIDPNVMLVAECQALPIEVVVRAYITGVTDTSLWRRYSEGERIIYGLKFPEGLVKNQKLKKPVITPTTRATGPAGHDEPISAKEILKRKIIAPNIWKQIEKVALKLFERGTQTCDKAGLILVDTKYEFGLDKKGKLMLIDEIHTPDSSRFWIKKTYAQKFKKGQEPENYDKEFMRLWFVEQGYRGKGKVPKMPPEFIAKIAERYISVYEKLSAEKFEADLTTSPKQRILASLSKLI